MKDNKIKMFMLTILIALISLPAIVLADSEYNGLTYRVQYGTAYITGVSDNVPSVVEIPSKIDGNYVRGIDSKAFYNVDNVEKIIIPSDVDITKIEQNTFEGMDSLVSVEISAENLNWIDDEAFANCPKLQNVILPESLTEIDNGAFYNDFSLKSINIPDSVTTLGTNFVDISKYGVFQNCYNLKEIKIPSSLKKIGIRAFYRATSLSKIDLPKVESYNDGSYIGDEAFAYSGLTEAAISTKINLGEYLFYKCKKLNKVTFLGTENSYITIPEGMFEDCINLSIVNFNNYSLNVNAYAFKGTTSLKTIDLSKSYSIGKEAFAYSGIKDIKLTASVIENSAFKDSLLENVEINSDYIRKINDSAFENCKKLNKVILRYFVYEGILGENVFKNTNVTLYTYKSDFMEKYAKQNNIKYVILDSSPYIDVTIDPISAQLYTGKEIKPKITVRDKDKILVEGVDYVVTYYNNIEVGKGNIRIEGKGIYYKTHRYIYFNIEKKLDDGLHLNSESNFEYFKNGKIDTTFTGIIEHNKSENQYLNGLYYVNKGRVDRDYYGLIYYNSKWYYISYGKVEDSYTGLAKNKNDIYLVINGKINFDYTGPYITYYCVSEDKCSDIFILKNSKLDANANGLKYVAGNWYYFKNGMKDDSYFGFFTNTNGTYYVTNGEVNFDYNGLVYYNKKWTPVVNSKVNNSYTGVLSNKNGKYLLEKGKITYKYNGFYKDGDKVYKLKNSKVDTSYTGLKSVDGTWYYFVKGENASNYTGFASNSNGTYYVQKGIITFKYSELVKYNGKWAAVVASKIQPNYTGISSNRNGNYYLEKGVLSFKYNGTYKDSKGNIYIFKNSKQDISFTGLKKVNGIWYYFENGITDYTYTGLVSNSNGTYYVEKGILTFKYNGTYKDNTGNVYILKNSSVDKSFTGLKKVSSTWYYFKNGKTDLTYTGYASNNNGTFYVENGIITFKFNKLVKYNGKWAAIVASKVQPNFTGISTNNNGSYYLKNGEVQFGFSGTITWKGKTYTVVKGKVNI